LEDCICSRVDSVKYIGHLRFPRWAGRELKLISTTNDGQFRILAWCGACFVSAQDSQALKVSQKCLPVC